MRVKKSILAPVVLGISGLLVAVYAMSPEPAVTEARAAEASIATGEARKIVGPGRVEPATGEIDLAAEIPGVVAKVHVKEGDEVKKGQVVAELVQNDLVARIAEAEAVHKLRTIEYTKKKNGARTEEKKEAQARLEELEHAQGLLEKRIKRQQKLFKDGFLTPDAMDEALATLGEATSRKKAAAQSFELLKAGTRVEEIEAAKTEVELAKAQLDAAKAMLEKSRVRATVDGTVLRLYRKVGEAASIQPPAPVMQVGDLKNLIVRVQIDESDIQGLKKGLRAEVRASGYPGQVFGGVVTDISPRVGGKTILTGEPTEKVDTYVLDVKIALDPGIVLPIGMRVDAFIIPNDKSDAPATAAMGSNS